MRRALALLGARGTVALILVLLVFGIVGVAKLAGGDDTAGPGVRMSGGGNVPSAVDPTAGDDGVAVTTPSAYPDDPEVRSAATAFATAWLRRDLGAAAWHTGIAAHATKSLTKSLKDVDPKTVPASRIAGTVATGLRTANYAEVTIPVDSGTLRLLLQKQRGAWLVNGVDWERQT